MTLPPPQGPYGSQPSGGGGPQWGGPPPQGPGPQPQYGQPGAPWVQQPQWVAPPPNKGGRGKWILVGLALVAIIAVSIVGTVLVLRPDSGDGNGQQSNTANGDSEFASANDTGPANIIADDPTCPAWVKISGQMSAVSNAVDWNKQDYSVPATSWTPEQRAAFDKKSAALTTAIEKVTALAKQTPHRLMRELYNQYIAYSQALIDSIPTYTAADQYDLQASNRFFSTLNEVCDAIHFKAAQESAPLIPVPSAPSDLPASNSDSALLPTRLLAGHNDTCNDWTAMVERVDKDTAEWRAIDPKIRATEWTPEQKAVVDAVTPIMSTYADDVERLGRQSGVPVWEDFSVFSAQYMRAFILAIPEYTPSASYLAAVTVNLTSAVYWACKAES